jgi:hypothetical protein
MNRAEERLLNPPPGGRIEAAGCERGEVFVEFRCYVAFDSIERDTYKVEYVTC